MRKKTRKESRRRGIEEEEEEGKEEGRAEMNKYDPLNASTHRQNRYLCWVGSSAAASGARKQQLT